MKQGSDPPLSFRRETSILCLACFHKSFAVSFAVSGQWRRSGTGKERGIEPVRAIWGVESCRVPPSAPPFYLHFYCYWNHKNCSYCKVMPPIFSAILCLQEMAVKNTFSVLYSPLPILPVPFYPLCSLPNVERRQAKERLWGILRCMLCLLPPTLSKGSCVNMIIPPPLLRSLFPFDRIGSVTQLRAA